MEHILIPGCRYALPDGRVAFVDAAYADSMYAGLFGYTCWYHIIGDETQYKMPMTQAVKVFNHIMTEHV